MRTLIALGDVVESYYNHGEKFSSRVVVATVHIVINDQVLIINDTIPHYVLIIMVLRKNSIWIKCWQQYKHFLIL